MLNREYANTGWRGHSLRVRSGQVCPREVDTYWARLSKKQIVFAAKPSQLLRSSHRNAHAIPQQRIKRLHPKHLAPERTAEVARYRLRHLVQVKFPPQFFLHRSHRLRSNSTRNDQIKTAEISIYIQSKAMRSNRA